MTARKVETCNLCDAPGLEPILDMGPMPLPNRLPRPGDPSDERYPLDVVLCRSCGLVQLGHAVPPEEMFSHYSYVPSTSAALREHFSELAEVVADWKEPRPDGLAVDIGSNDGLLLSYLKGMGFNVLGIDPARNLASPALARGVPTETAFFDEEVGRAHAGEADVVTATNCLAHTSNLRSYLRGVAAMLKPDGVFIAEFPYLPRLLEGRQFDTIYHEHQSYFALTPLAKTLPSLGLRVVCAHPIPVHGGSLRLWARKLGGAGEYCRSLRPMLAHEDRWRLKEEDTYAPFADAVYGLRRRMRSLLRELGGAFIVGLGASAKLSILANYCGIGPAAVRWVADANPMKQGRCIPGVRIPIVPEETLAEGPEYVLVGAWNLMDDMRAKVARYCPGAKLIVPVPEPRVLEPEGART